MRQRPAPRSLRAAGARAESFRPGSGGGNRLRMGWRKFGVRERALQAAVVVIVVIVVVAAVVALVVAAGVGVAVIDRSYIASIAVIDRSGIASMAVIDRPRIAAVISCGLRLCEAIVCVDCQCPRPPGMLPRMPPMMPYGHRPSLLHRTPLAQDAVSHRSK